MKFNKFSLTTLLFVTVGAAVVTGCKGATHLNHVTVCAQVANMPKGTTLKPVLHFLAVHPSLGVFDKEKELQLDSSGYGCTSLSEPKWDDLHPSASRIDEDSFCEFADEQIKNISLEFGDQVLQGKIEDFSLSEYPSLDTTFDFKTPVQDILDYNACVASEEAEAEAQTE